MLMIFVLLVLAGVCDCFLMFRSVSFVYVCWLYGVCGVLVVGCVVEVGGSVKDTLLALGSACIYVLCTCIVFPGTTGIFCSYFIIRCVILFSLNTFLGGWMGLRGGDSSLVDDMEPCLFSKNFY